MKFSQKGYSTIIALIFIVLVVIGAVGWYVSRNNLNTITPASSQVILMAVTAEGGLCSGPCTFPIHNLYDDGSFDGYQKLSSSEVIELKKIINDTDFFQYRPKPESHCPSAVDGTDQVLLFPQKYGDQAFIPCALDIPDKDPAFTFIDSLIVSHALNLKSNL